MRDRDLASGLSLVLPVHPSGMARDMGGGMGVYVLSARPGLRRRLPLVGTFEPAPKESVGTVDDQDAYYRRWLESRRR